MALQLVDAPADLFIDLATVKAHLRIDHDAHDDLLELLIAAETAYAEKFTGLALALQTWDYYQDAFPAEADPQIIRLPLGRVTDIDAVYYLDASGTEQTLDAALYDIDLAGIPARVALASSATWPPTYDGVNAVRVRFTAGVDTGISPNSAEEMKDIQLAIMLRVQAGYDGGDRAQALLDASEIYLKRRRVIVSFA
ncbi:MAG: head-tail connector protein [Hyphomonadaceae bacterium]|nr:head-tail connector protein [Hyphomonadaceae bacterium]